VFGLCLAGPLGCFLCFSVVFFLDGYIGVSLFSGPLFYGCVLLLYSLFVVVYWFIMYGSVRGY